MNGYSLQMELLELMTDAIIAVKNFNMTMTDILNIFRNTYTVSNSSQNSSMVFKIFTVVDNCFNKYLYTKII